MAKREAVLLTAFFIVLLTAAASAEVWLVTQPKTIYNIGDNLEIRVGVSSPGEQLLAELQCSNKTQTIFLQYITNNTDIEMVQPLTPDFLNQSLGDCEVQLKYGDSQERSQRFIISKSIFLTIETKDQYFEPGKNMAIRGNAEKANGNPLEGFYEISFPETNFSRTGNVEGGKFEVNLSLPEKIKAGNYIMNTSVYDKTDGRKANKGESRITIKVKQVPTEINIALDNQNVKPGENLSFIIMLYDQSGEKVEGDASYIIENPDGIEIKKQLSEIEKTEAFLPEKNLTPGYYKIKAYSSGLSKERQFYVEENEEASFRIVNGTLTVKNIGNVEYDRAIQVDIGGVVEIINHRFALGEEKTYEMVAPEGNYEVKITDGDSTLETKNLGLTTGRAVALREVGEGFLERSKILAWVFIILVLGMFIFVTSRRTIRKKFVLTDRIFGRKKREEKKGGVVKVKPETNTTELKKDARTAEHSLVLQGKKYETPVICLKIKNQLDGSAKLNLESILRVVYDSKGTIYRTGEYIIPVFSPLTTSTFKNHIPAVKAAMEIQKKLQEHNKKFRDKIDYGISVHSGELASQKHENKLKFTGVGNTIPTAKKIADISDKELLLSREIHEKTVAQVKTAPVRKGEMQLFTVKNMINREQNKLYIQEFLKRLEDGKK
jgi:hypothetical protein